MHATGGPDIFTLEPIELPPLGPRDVRIAVAAAGVNYADRLVRSGALPAPALPHVLGYEVAGVVDALGAEVTELALGARVAAELRQGGGYATHAIAPAELVIPLPDGLEYADALALVISGRTALLMLRHARVAPNETVVIPSALGGVGSIAVQLATSLGAIAIAGVGSAAKRGAALALGASAAVVFEPGWADAVLAATAGAGADVVFQSTGGELGAESLRALAPGGRLVMFGADNVVHPDPLASAQVRGFLAKGQTVGGFSLLGQPVEVRRRAFDELARRVTSHTLAPVIQRFSLAEVSRAHADLDARRTTGKVVLEA
jgi:NADPH2:quinone reductase